MTSVQIRPSMYDCRGCALADTRTQIVDGAGPTEARLIVIGEAPGAEEDKLGSPFVGRSGKLLRAVLSAGGMPDGNYYLTNTVKCRPPDNRDPLPEEVRACAGWLHSEFGELSGRVVLALGKHAQATVRGLGLPESYTVVEAFHPAFILRSSRFRAKWEEDIFRAVRLANGAHEGQSQPEQPPTPGAYDVQLPDPRSEWFAADIETSNLQDYITTRMVGWSVSDGDSGQFFQYARGRDYRPLPHRGHTWLHNAKYDAESLGIDLRRLDTWDDTMLMAYVLRRPVVGLKPTTLDLTGWKLRNIKDILGTGRKAILFDVALARDPSGTTSYAIEDAVATSRIAPILAAELATRPDSYRYYHEIEKPAVAVLHDLEKRGVRVDPDALITLQTKLEDDIGKCDQIIADYVGDAPNPASNDQMAQVFIDQGFTLTKQTPKTGKWQLDEPVLAGIIQEGIDRGLDTTVASQLQLRRIAAKLKSTYADSLLEKRDEADRVHARYNQTVAATNRLSSEDPNLQNIPIRGTIKKTIRRAFIPRPGCGFVKADASQLEVRVYADYTRELVLVDAYLHDDHDTAGPEGNCLRCDVHQQVADALGIPRWRAKNTLFAAIYGASPPKMAQTAGVSVDETAGFLDTMRRNVPSLLSWQSRCADELHRQGYITTLLGWRGYYPLFASPVRQERAAALREAGNFPIQGTGAGIIKVLFTEADALAAEYDGQLVLTVHDEVVYEMPAAGVVEFSKKLQLLGQDIASRYLKLIPFVLEISSGPNWGDCEVLHV